MSVSINSSGVLIPVKGVGKDNKFLPWSMVKKVLLPLPSSTAPMRSMVWTCTSSRSTVNGSRLEGVYDTKREAFRAVDIHLIKNGKEPELILKKA